MVIGGHFFIPQQPRQIKNIWILVTFKQAYFHNKNIVMIIVHDIFVCKPGNASKLAKLFKEVMTGNTELVNIMTDMTGQYNRVIMVSKYENLTAYEQSWEKYKEDTEEMKKAIAKHGSAVSIEISNHIIEEKING